MTQERSDKSDDALDVSHPCWTGVERDFDHDWHYDGGDYTVGINPGWVCHACDSIDTDREAPSYDDDY